MKLVQAAHMLFYAPYRSLAACVMSLVILLLESSYVWVLMEVLQDPSKTSDLAVRRHACVMLELAAWRRVFMH